MGSSVFRGPHPGYLDPGCVFALVAGGRRSDFFSYLGSVPGASEDPHCRRVILAGMALLDHRLRSLWPPQPDEDSWTLHLAQFAWNQAAASRLCAPHMVGKYFASDADKASSGRQKDPAFQCCFCNKRYHSKHGLEVHQRYCKPRVPVQNTAGQAEASSSCRVDSRVLYCYPYSATDPNASELTSSGLKEYPCSICGKRHKSRYAAAGHMRHCKTKVPGQSTAGQTVSRHALGSRDVGPHVPKRPRTKHQAINKEGEAVLLVSEKSGDNQDSGDAQGGNHDDDSGFHNQKKTSLREPTISLREQLLKVEASDRDPVAGLLMLRYPELEYETESDSVESASRQEEPSAIIQGSSSVLGPYVPRRPRT